MTAREQAGERATPAATNKDRWRDELAAVGSWLEQQARRIDPAAPTAQDEIVEVFLIARRRLDGLCDRYLGEITHSTPQPNTQHTPPGAHV